MQNELTLCAERLKNVLINDKKDNPNKILNVLKSDILYVLKNYMEISCDDVDLSIQVTHAGTYTVSMIANVKRIKTLNCIE